MFIITPQDIRKKLDLPEVGSHFQIMALRRGLTLQMGYCNEYMSLSQSLLIILLARCSFVRPINELPYQMAMHVTWH